MAEPRLLSCFSISHASQGLDVGQHLELVIPLPQHGPVVSKHGTQLSWESHLLTTQEDDTSGGGENIDIDSRERCPGLDSVKLSFQAKFASWARAG